MNIVFTSTISRLETGLDFRMNRYSYHVINTNCGFHCRSVMRKLISVYWSVMAEQSMCTMLKLRPLQSMGSNPDLVVNNDALVFEQDTYTIFEGTKCSRSNRLVCT